MVLQNGVVDSAMEEAPLPCQAGDVIEVPSVSVENYTYLLRIPSLSDRIRLEARLNRMRPRLNQTPRLVQLYRTLADKLNAALGKPVLFEQVLMRLENEESL